MEESKRELNDNGSSFSDQDWDEYDYEEEDDARKEINQERKEEIKGGGLRCKNKESNYSRGNNKNGYSNSNGMYSNKQYKGKANYYNNGNNHKNYDYDYEYEYNYEDYNNYDYENYEYEYKEYDNSNNCSNSKWNKNRTYRSEKNGRSFNNRNNRNRNDNERSYRGGDNKEKNYFNNSKESKEGIVNRNAFFTKKGNSTNAKQNYTNANNRQTNYGRNNNSYTDTNSNTKSYEKRTWNAPSNNTISPHKQNKNNINNDDDIHIEKPIFYNSKKQGMNAPPPIPETQTLFIHDIINLNKIPEEILTLKLSQIQLYKESTKKDLEKEYGSLNINARNYIPKKKQIQ